MFGLHDLQQYAQNLNSLDALYLTFLLVKDHVGSTRGVELSVCKRSTGV